MSVNTNTCRCGWKLCTRDQVISGAHPADDPRALLLGHVGRARGHPRPAVEQHDQQEHQRHPGVVPQCERDEAGPADARLVVPVVLAVLAEGVSDLMGTVVPIFAPQHGQVCDVQVTKPAMPMRRSSPSPDIRAVGSPAVRDLRPRPRVRSRLELLPQPPPLPQPLVPTIPRCLYLRGKSSPRLVPSGSVRSPVARLALSAPARSGLRPRDRVCVAAVICAALRGACPAGSRSGRGRGRASLPAATLRA